MLDAVIFDLDGLLVDTEVPYYRVWRDLYEEHGCELPLEPWLLCVGRADVVDFWELLEQRASRPVDRETLGRQLRERFHRELERGPLLMPGARQALESLTRRGLRLGVASTADREWVVRTLDKTEILGYFGAVVTGSDTRRGKPAPDVYLRCAELLGVLPERCLALEDSCYGLEAAKGAGMRCYVVPNELTRQQDLSAADRVLGSLEQLATDGLQLP